MAAIISATQLPIFSSDALSSNAYATEAILGVLIVKADGRAALRRWGIAIGIALLLITVVLSYRQIIFAYPDGGGRVPGLARQSGHHRLAGRRRRRC